MGQPTHQSVNHPAADVAANCCRKSSVLSEDLFLAFTYEKSTLASGFMLGGAGSARRAGSERLPTGTLCVRFVTSYDTHVPAATPQQQQQQQGRHPPVFWFVHLMWLVFHCHEHVN